MPLPMSVRSQQMGTPAWPASVPRLSTATARAAARGAARVRLARQVNVSPTCAAAPLRSDCRFGSETSVPRCRPTEKRPTERRANTWRLFATWVSLRSLSSLGADGTRKANMKKRSAIALGLGFTSVVFVACSNDGASPGTGGESSGGFGAAAQAGSSHAGAAHGGAAQGGAGGDVVAGAAGQFEAGAGGEAGALTAGMAGTGGDAGAGQAGAHTGGGGQSGGGQSGASSTAGNGGSGGGAPLACSSCPAGQSVVYFGTSSTCLTSAELASPAFGCGTGGAACLPPHAVPKCAANACAIAHCDTGWGDCDSNAANGCETDLSLPGSCHACGAVCTGGNVSVWDCELFWRLCRSSNVR